MSSSVKDEHISDCIDRFANLNDLYGRTPDETSEIKQRICNILASVPITETELKPSIMTKRLLCSYGLTNRN